MYCQVTHQCSSQQLHGLPRLPGKAVGWCLRKFFRNPSSLHISFVCEHVCVCAWERERERDNEGLGVRLRWRGQIWKHQIREGGSRSYREQTSVSTFYTDFQWVWQRQRRRTEASSERLTFLCSLSLSPSLSLSLRNSTAERKRRVKAAVWCPICQKRHHSKNK